MHMGKRVRGRRRNFPGTLNPQASLTGHAKWEPLELPEPIQVVNLKQCRILGGQKEITTLISDMLGAGVLAPINSLYNSPVWPVRKADGSWRLTDY